VAQGGSNKISDILAKGEVLEGHRSRLRARRLLPDLRQTLQLPAADDPQLDPLLEEFVIEVVLGAGWYEKKYHGAYRKVWLYIVINILLVIGIPLGLIGLGKLGNLSPSGSAASQITGVLTGILALQKTLSTWYASQQRYAVWYKAAADLKTIYYGLVQAWAGKAATSRGDFITALMTATDSGRKIIADEQLDFYQKLAMPSFDVLDMLTSTRSTVSSFVANLLPGTDPTTVSAAGKNALPSTIPPQPGGVVGGGATGGGGITSPGVTLRAAGAVKPNDNPYAIVIVANPALLTQGGQLMADPIMAQAAQFETCVQYIMDSLFGRLPGQAETFLVPFEPLIRIISIFDTRRPVTQANCLAQEYDSADGIIEPNPNQDVYTALLAQYQYNGKPIKADVVFAVTNSPTHTRCSAFYTYDNDSGAGVPFQLDARTHTHRYNNVDPGAVALHVSSTSVVALHEFGHAASSWTNGSVKDLYVDSDLSNLPVNIRDGRPIPVNFATYKGTTYPADQTRDGIGYDPTWRSFHCALVDPNFPSVMDNFWDAAGGQYAACKHDQITVAFLTERLRAITSGP
jgi:hypothetical protein